MSTITAPVRVVEYSMDELRSILQRSREGELSEADREKLWFVIESYAHLLGEIKDKKATIARLRQLVFGTKTESKANVLRRAGKASLPDGDEEGPKKKPRPKRKGHGRFAAEAYAGAERVKIPLEGFKPGGPCPKCTGRVYGQKPRLIVRIQGRAPFDGTIYEQECSRCNLCGRVFKAKMPPEVGEKKFDETVASMAAVLRYGSGLPMNRIEELQRGLGVPLPVLTQWELMRDAAGLLQAAYLELIGQAAQGEILYNDDTTMRILDFITEQNERRARGEKPLERTGTFTSGIVSALPGGRTVVLYFTGRQHAGENLARVLAERAVGLGPPIQMCDGLSRNAPGQIKTILSNCLTHARRQFVDVAVSFPEEVQHVIEELSLIYKNDARTKLEGLSAGERLRLHQRESGPIMERLEIWLAALIEEKKVEPNSGLGKAIAYVQKRWLKLTLFLREPGAPLDNTLTERMLKKAIIHRKNSMFYKTAKGAAVGDLYMALIATAKLAGAEPFDYLNALQRHPAEVAADPAGWMPWSYRTSRLALEPTTAPP